MRLAFYKSQFVGGLLGVVASPKREDCAMRISVFSSFDIDSPRGGAEVRTREILKWLAQRGDSVQLHLKGKVDRSYRLDAILVNRVRSPISVRLLGSALLSRLVSLTASKYGLLALVSLDPVYAMRAHGSVKSSDVVIGRDVCELFPLLLARISKKPFVTDLGGFMFPQLASGGSRGIVSLLRILPIAILEMVTLRLSSHVIVSCSEDEMNLRRIFKLDAARIDVVENGVDFAEFLPRKENRKNIRAKLGVRGKDLLVVFVGNLMAPHNFTAAKFIVKGLAPATESRVHFLIVGPHGDLPPEWQRSDRVRFTGFVPSVAPYVNASDICIAPLFSGAGMKTKTLAYLACGKPILMTKEAATGLALVDGRDAVICDMGSMPGLLTHLAVNGRLRLQLGMNAFAAGRKLDWSLRAAKFRNVLEKVVIMTHACNPTSDIKHSSHTAECDVDGQV